MYDILDPDLNTPCKGPDPRRIQLPLDIMSAIISHLKSPADLSCIARSSRINHFLAIPLLYHTVALRRPLRRHNASRKRMALAVLMKPGIAACVSILEIVGSDDHTEEVEWWDSGQWSDEETVWAVAVAGVLAGMVRLDAFLWNAGGHVHPLLHAAILRHPSVKTLRISHPMPVPPSSPSSSLVTLPHLHRPPTTSLPAFRTLHTLALVNLPAESTSTDDYTTAIFFSPLSSLSLSWRTPTSLAHLLPLQRLFCQRPTNPPKFRLKSLHLRNVIFDLPTPSNIDDWIDLRRLETLSLIDCDIVDAPSWLEIVGASPDKPSPTPSDNTPGTSASSSSSSLIRTPQIALKSLRINSTAPHYISLLNAFDGLTSLYILDPPTPSPDERATASSFLDAITRHGPTLTQLRLCSRWTLERRDVSRLFKACSGLEELAFSMLQSQWKILDVLIIFLTRIRIIHIIDISPLTREEVVRDLDGKQEGVEKMLAQEEMMSVEVFAFEEVAYRVDRTVCWGREGRVRRGRFVPREEVKEWAGVWRAERVD